VTHFERVVVAPGVTLGWGGWITEYGYAAKYGSSFWPYSIAPVEKKGSYEKRLEAKYERRADPGWFGSPCGIW